MYVCMYFCMYFSMYVCTYILTYQYAQNPYYNRYEWACTFHVSLSLSTLGIAGLPALRSSWEPSSWPTLIDQALMQWELLRQLPMRRLVIRCVLVIWALMWWVPMWPVLMRRLQASSHELGGSWKLMSWPSRIDSEMSAHESGTHENSWAESSWVLNFSPVSFYPHRGGSAEDARKICGGTPRETILSHHSWLRINFNRHIYIYIYIYMMYTIYTYVPDI